MNELIAPSRGKGLLREGVVKLLKVTRLNAIASDLYYEHLHGFRPASTGLDEGFELIFEHARKLGSFRNAPAYCEFGLFKGYSFWKAQTLANKLQLGPIQFWGFDSFEGLPAATGVDRECAAEFRKGQYACSMDAVRANLDAAGGVDWRRTHLVKGYFNESLQPDRAGEYDIPAVGVAMIDCDLYESTVDVLAFLRGRLRDKSILIMDDWNCFARNNRLGQRRALREFLAGQAGMRVDPLCGYGANSQAFVVSTSMAA